MDWSRQEATPGTEVRELAARLERSRGIRETFLKTEIGNTEYEIE